MHELEIESLAFGGDAVGHLDGKVVFVPFAAPGDRVRLRLLRETASYCRGELLDVVRPGPGRRPPPCPYFGRCGGCQWQQLDYPHQLENKQSILSHALSGPGLGGEAALLEPIQGAPRELAYRRRVRMHWQRDAAGLQLGYQRWRSHDLLDVELCPKLEEPLQRGVDACRRALSVDSSGTRGAGTIVALLGARGRVHVSLRVERGDSIWAHRIVRAVDEPIVGGVGRTGRQKPVSFGRQSVELPGSEGEEQPLRGAATAFVQASVEGEQALRRIVLDWSAASGQSVLELYAGIGTFTRDLAEQASEVVAVELATESLSLLRDNCATRSIRVNAGDALAIARELASAGERFNVAVLDPPREGGPGLARQVARLQVQRVVYVSCDPMTLARDLREWRAEGFQLRRAVGIDLMPQTYHIEAVALLERV